LCRAAISDLPTSERFTRISRQLFIIAEGGEVLGRTLRWFASTRLRALACCLGG
jgi:hypothetical protein